MPDRRQIDADEQVLFFPTVAARDGDGSWSIPIHGWIYQPVHSSRLRRAALWLTRRYLRRRLHAPATPFDLPLARERLAPFFTDNERGERIRIHCAGREFPMRRSRADGHFEATISLSAAAADRFAAPAPGARWLPFRAILPDHDHRTFEGRALLLEPTGTSVISDIDDTIKMTGIGHRQTTLRSTFSQPFAHIPGMPELYARLHARHNAAFHYVSASPWQLFPFLCDSLTAASFPEGSFHLRRLRLYGRTLLTAFASSATIKRRHLNALLTRFPNRKFILLGDSGESDPQLYTAAARKFPAQIQAIYIRKVVDSRASITQPSLPDTDTRFFSDPSQLP